MTKFRIVIFILIFPSIFFTLKCNNKTTEPEPIKPNQPEFVSKSLDSAEKETGIDAIPDGDGIILEWNLSNLDIVEWIKIYKFGGRIFR